jgi:hypothetical protein
MESPIENRNGHPNAITVKSLMERRLVALL